MNQKLKKENNDAKADTLLQAALVINNLKKAKKLTDEEIISLIKGADVYKEFDDEGKNILIENLIDRGIEPTPLTITMVQNQKLKINNDILREAIERGIKIPKAK